MQPKSDAQLLREYAEHGAESAFAEIVARHTNLVYSAALRQVDSPDIAAEVAQSVFIGLARGARALSPKLAGNASLAGWLCRSARNISLNLRRDEFRRHSRERQAMENLNSTPDTAPDWERLRPVLDEAMAELSEPDYDALVLRFFKNQDLRSVGLGLGVSDDAAQKRVSRALDKLRDLLSHRGITTSAAALSVVLSANAVQAAPVGLALTISAAAALAGGAAQTSTAIAATKAIAMTTLQKTIIGATLAAAVGTGIYEGHQASNLKSEVRALQQQQAPSTTQVGLLRRERDEATSKLAALQQENGRLHRDTAELAKLRGEVARLRSGARELGQSNTAAADMNDPFTRSVLAMTARAVELKQHLEQMPDKKIPELQLLIENDWLSAAKNAQFDTEADIRKALGKLRNLAKDRLPIGSSLFSFTRANNGQLPTDLAQLKPYFKSALGDITLDDATLDAIFDRYQLLHTGNLSDLPPNASIVAEKAPVDKDYDTLAIFGNGFSTSTRPQ